MTVQVLTGDARDLLPTLAERSVQACITSPPYWSLRSYLPTGHEDKAREIGAEASPSAFVQALVDVFALVWKVLRDDGVAFLNIGDSYAGSWGNYAPGGIKGVQRPRSAAGRRWTRPAYVDTATKPAAADVAGIRPKSLCLIPQRLAIALQDWGWIVRSIIIWSKDNPMPESVRDRPTTAHEYILLLAKQERYCFDSVAIAEPAVSSHGSGNGYKRPQQISRGGRGSDEPYAPQPTRNARSVWHLNAQPYQSGQPDVDHFAVMPEKLAERCLLASTSPRACPTCSAPWRRVVERSSVIPIDHGGKCLTQEPQFSARRMNANRRARREATGVHDNPFPTPLTTGWAPTCRCPDNDGSGRCVVLDCFSGSGTTLQVATKHGRDAIGIDLNPAYEVLQDDRTSGVQLSMASLL